MICAELEQLESELDDVVTALEKPELTPEEKSAWSAEYVRISQAITEHEHSGHQGGPCYEE